MNDEFVRRIEIYNWDINCPIYVIFQKKCFEIIADLIAKIFNAENVLKKLLSSFQLFFLVSVEFKSGITSRLSSMLHAW